MIKFYAIAPMNTTRKVFVIQGHTKVGIRLLSSLNKKSADVCVKN